MEQKMKISNIQTLSNLSTTNKIEVAKKQTGALGDFKNRTINLNNYPNSSCLVSFKSNYFNNKNAEEKKEIRIEDVFKECSKSLPASYFTPDDANLKKDINKDNLKFDLVREKSVTKYIFSDDNGIIFQAKIKNGVDFKDLPKVTYKQGKYKPDVAIKDPKTLDDTRIKMFAGSIMKGDNFVFIMPGTSVMPNGKKIDVSFKGSQIGVSTLNLEDRTKDAIALYMEAKLQNKVMPGHYKNIIDENQPTLFIPAGGFGERYKNMTRGGENKPSSYLPTTRKCRVIGTTLNLAASAGLLDGKNKNDIFYLSQNNTIQGFNVANVGKYKSDGGALCEALKDSKIPIPMDKDLIILNADIFTNADITRTYKALKNIKDAAVVIPYYSVNSERAKAFGLMGVKKSENDENALQITEFVEKPSHTVIPPSIHEFLGNGQSDIEANKKYENAQKMYLDSQSARIVDSNGNQTNDFYSNPGMYFISKDVLPVFVELLNKELGENENYKNMSTEEQLKHGKPKSYTGLGACIIPEIVKRCNEGTLKNADGKNLKAYTVPLQRVDGKQAFWDDIGSAEAYLKVIREVAYDTKTHGNTPENRFYGVPDYVLKDFKNATKLGSKNQNVVFLSAKAKKDATKFLDRYNAKMKGNIFVTDAPIIK